MLAYDTGASGDELKMVKTKLELTSLKKSEQLEIRWLMNLKRSTVNTIHPSNSYLFVTLIEAWAIQNEAFQDETCIYYTVNTIKMLINPIISILSAK